MGRAGVHSWRNSLPGACLGGILSALAVSLAAAAPPNDDFANATVLTGVTNFIVSANTEATSQPGEPLHADSAGGRSVWWTWQSPFTGSVSISTRGSSFDTLLAVYTGDSVSNLQAVADNDDVGIFGFVSSALIFRALAGEMYRIAVDGFNGATGTVQLAVGRAGYPSPAWSLVSSDGRLVESTEFRNRVLVLDIFETTCGACVEEVPSLIQLQTGFSAEGFTLFGVAKDPPGTDLSYFAKAHHISYEVAMGDADMEDAFGPTFTFPTKFVIDRENMVVAQLGGGGDYAYYAKLVKPLLRGLNKLPLTVRRGNAAIVFAWPASEFGYNVESKTTLESTNWAVSLFPVVTTNEQNTVTVPAGASSQFFRLRKTPAP
jgi:peroxiredoxin